MFDTAINRKTGQIVQYHEVDGCAVAIHETKEVLYGGDFIKKYMTDYDIKSYQNKNRIYIYEYPDQEKLRSDYFRKTRDNYFWNRFMEVK